MQIENKVENFREKLTKPEKNMKIDWISKFGGIFRNFPQF